MKNFIYKTALFISVITIAVALLPFLEEDIVTSNEFMAAMRDKHQRVKEINTPKLILAGGSNLVFGVDSERLEKELKTPIVNLGLRAHLGVNFILNELRDVAKQGDVIVLSLEHFMDVKGDENLHLLTSYYNPNALKYYEEKDYSRFRLFLDYRHMLFKKLIAEYITKGDPLYSRNDFNVYGDGIKHLNLPNPKVLGSRYVIDSNKEKEIKALNGFYEYAQQKNITVVYSYSPYAYSEYKRNEKELLLLHKNLKEDLKIKVVTKLQDFVYPESYFFDNVYHLNAKGREIHTNKLISLLSKEIISK